MTLSKNKSYAFYQNLGKLFYAIAATDNNVDEMEYETLKKLVQSKALHFSFDNTNADTVQEIVLTFNDLQTKSYNADTSFEEFISFKRQNEVLFTDANKLTIMKAANRIASSFSYKNKSELIMIAKLDIEFKTS